MRPADRACTALPTASRRSTGRCASRARPAPGRGVQKHITAVFAKLGLTEDEDDNRRILAVLGYLRPGGTG